MSPPDASGDYEPSGGNEGDQYSVGKRNVSSPTLLGFVSYPQRERAPAPVDESPAPADLSNLVAVSDAVMRGDYGLDAALDDFEDPDHAEEESVA